MRRRGLLLSLAGLSTLPAVTKTPRKTEGAGQDLANPYADVDWDNCDWLHSMSHQHQGQTDTSRDVFLGMGYRHFAFSNYYPSAPTYPLPEDYRAKHPEVIGAPNAEHHSFTDTGLHCNATRQPAGNRLRQGAVGAKERAAAPLVQHFDG